MCGGGVAVAEYDLTFKGIDGCKDRYSDKILSRKVKLRIPS